MNPVATGGGLALNISKDDNRQNIGLVMSVAPHFHVSDKRAKEIFQEVVSAVKSWPELAEKLGIPSREMSLMKGALRVAEMA